MSRRSARKRVLAIVLLVLAAGLLRAADVRGAAPDASQAPFPDFGHLPRGYRGKVFKLSQDYPVAKPTTLPPFVQTDSQGDWVEDYLRKNWKSYMIDIRRYCYEGNLEADWRSEDNPVRRWYHVPWQHFGPNGREGIHGMTKEAEVKKYQLEATQSYEGGQTYAVAFYNDLAGYALGQVWKDHDRPDLKATEFPNGAFICKLLFVDVPTEQVPSLVDPVLWQGFICDNYASFNRSVRPLALIQMDIMVRDDRTPTGWLFGTFQYNGAMKAKNRWDNMVPVGVQWGNDEGVRTDHYHITCPERTEIVAAIRESIINDDRNELPPTHLGWNGRLNGPVDNPRSSCMSCHATAEYPVKSEMAPFFEANPPSPGDARWMRWFTNHRCASKGGVPFDEGSHSADFCLQLVQGVDNFHAWRRERGGVFASEYGRHGIPEHPEPSRDRPETDISARNDLGLQPRPLSGIQAAPEPRPSVPTRRP